MTQGRQRVRIEKKQYFDRNIWDMSIDITYFVLDILQVVISRSTYYISLERMCLTGYGLQPAYARRSQKKKKTKKKKKHAHIVFIYVVP